MFTEKALDMLGESLVDAVQGSIEKAGRNVFDQLGIDATIQRVRTIPDVIRRCQDDMQIAQSTLAEAKGELELAKGEIMAEIRDEINGNGKPKFSNQEARDDEFIKRAKVDDEFQSVLKRYMDAEETLNCARFAVDRAMNEFAAMRAVLAAQTAKVNLLAGML